MLVRGTCCVPVPELVRSCSVTGFRRMGSRTNSRVLQGSGAPVRCATLALT